MEYYFQEGVEAWVAANIYLEKGVNWISRNGGYVYGIYNYDNKCGLDIELYGAYIEKKIILFLAD